MTNLTMAGVLWGGVDHDNIMWNSKTLEKAFFLDYGPYSCVCECVCMCVCVCVCVYVSVCARGNVCVCPTMTNPTNCRNQEEKTKP